MRIAAIAFESQDGMIVTDAQTKILRVNSAFTQITGYSAPEAIGQTPRMLRSDRHDANFYASMWTAAEQLEKEVAQLAFFAPLTQLPNRRRLSDRLGQAFTRATRLHATRALDTQEPTVRGCELPFRFAGACRRATSFERGNREMQRDGRYRPHGYGI